MSNQPNTDIIKIINKAKIKNAIKLEKQLNKLIENKVKFQQLQIQNQQVDKLKQGEYDWTSDYKKWDKWYDLEEAAIEEEKERLKLENKFASTQCDHDHSIEKKIMEMTTQEKLNTSDSLRKTGNLFFYEGQYQKASYYYHKASIYFEYIFTESKEEEDILTEHKQKCLINNALCLVKLKEYDRALQYCDQVLESDSLNIKTYFCRAQANRGKDNYIEALADIQKALDIDPKNTMMLKELTLTQTMNAAYSLKSKAMGEAMFSTAKKKMEPPLITEKVPSCDTFNLWKPNELGIREMKILYNELFGEKSNNL